MANTQAIESAKEHFGTVLEQRVEMLKLEGDWTDYRSLITIMIGMAGGETASAT